MFHRRDKSKYGCKIVEKLDNTGGEDIYEEYIFVERRVYGKNLSLDYITLQYSHEHVDGENVDFQTFIDVKSEFLRVALRNILSDVKTFSVHADKPEVNLLTDLL